MSKVQDDYLSKATEAEAIAARFAEGSFERESWLKIAQGYRALLDGRPSTNAEDNKQA